MYLEDRIGPSTLIIGKAGAQAIKYMVNNAVKAGFKAVEICPAQFYSVDPVIDPSLLERVFREEDRTRLKDMLSQFHIVTVHGSSWWVTKIRENVCEEELWRPYIELLHFAHDIGAHIVSFHPLQRAVGCDLSQNEMVEYNIKFGSMAAEYADDLNLLAAFENMPRNGDWSLFENILDIVTKIRSEKFGLLFDIGHAALQVGTSTGIDGLRILRKIERCIHQTFELHVSGIQITGKEFNTSARDHRPLDEYNVLDYRQIMSLLKIKKFDGPIIFEIFYKNAGEKRASFKENLEACILAKKELGEYWISKSH